jgi:hypothetical protein
MPFVQWWCPSKKENSVNRIGVSWPPRKKQRLGLYINCLICAYHFLQSTMMDTGGCRWIRRVGVAAVMVVQRQQLLAVWLPNRHGRDTVLALGQNFMFGCNH